MFSLWEVWCIVVFSGSIRDNNQPIKKMKTAPKYSKTFGSRPKTIRAQYTDVLKALDELQYKFENIVLNSADHDNQQQLDAARQKRASIKASLAEVAEYLRSHIDAAQVVDSEYELIQAGTLVTHETEDFAYRPATVVEIDGRFAQIKFQDGTHDFVRIDSLTAVRA